MSVPFYDLSPVDSLKSWRLEIVRDARGAQGARYGWRDLSWARRVEVAHPLEIAVKRAGVRLDISFAQGMVPVLSAHAAQALRSLATHEIELISARVEGEADEYFVLNILSVVKCLDEEKTQYVKKWTKESSRPERAGGYSDLLGIVIDPEAAKGHNLFRLGGAIGHVIASRAVKEAFEREGLVGARFRDVCSPKPSVEEASSANDRYSEFYEQLLQPLVEAYGPVQEISSELVGFDGGGPVKTCVMRANNEGAMPVYATCELAVRAEQKPSRLGKYELLTICDNPEWARLILTRVAQLSMREVLDTGHTVDIGTAPKVTGSLEGVLLEAFMRKRVMVRDYAIFRCIGITRREMQFAKREGIEDLQERLIGAGVYAQTNCDRESVV